MRPRITAIVILLLAFFAAGSSKAPSAIMQADGPAARQAAGVTGSPLPARERPFIARNVIVLVGDGMGFEHIRAGGMYLNGTENTLVFEDFPYHAVMTTHSMTTENPTDSAAAATAMATGEKVINYVVSQDIPGDSHDMDTLLEYARDQGLSTGLVTTCFISDATPAAFGAHTGNRKNYDEIVDDYLSGSRPNVLFGGGGSDYGVSIMEFVGAGYTVVLDAIGLSALDTENKMYVSGQFGSGYMPYEAEGLGTLPHLSDMAATALQILDNDPDGFFAIIEGGRIDVASHGNKAAEMVGEVAEFDKTVRVVLEYAKAHPDTLVVVLADHETGGLKVLKNRGKGSVPDVEWSTKYHTGVDVGVWAYGPGIESFPETLDNTLIPTLLTGGKFP